MQNSNTEGQRRESEKADGQALRSKVFESHDLFGDQQEIRIKHKDEVYRLRITRNERLILNK